MRHLPCRRITFASSARSPRLHSIFQPTRGERPGGFLSTPTPVEVGSESQLQLAFREKGRLVQ